MKMKINLYITQILVFQLVLLQSCSCVAGEPAVVSDIPASSTTQLPPDSSDVSNSDYVEKLNSFIISTKSFDHERIASALETSNIFNEVKDNFVELLEEKESIYGLVSYIEKLIDAKTGFIITASKPIEANGTKYRFVELSNIYTERTDGAFDSLFVQYWTDTEIAYASLVESRPTSTNLTTVIDYRFIEDERVVLVVQKEYCDVIKYEDSYNLFLFKLVDGHIENTFPDAEISISNGYWAVSRKEYTFYNPERKITGFRVKEITEDDNAYRTFIEITGSSLVIGNLDSPESMIVLVLIEGTWQLSS